MSSRAARAFMAALTVVVGCSVYDASLLVGGTAGLGAAGSGAGGAGAKGGKGGASAGTTASGGAGGGTGGDGSGGSVGGASGSTGGSDGTGGSGGLSGEGGEAGIGEGASGGSGGTTGGAGGSGGTGGTTGGTGGSGGTGGTTGGTGGDMAGTGGSTGGGAGMSGSGGAGGAGAGGSAGAGGTPATGCAVLTTALDAEDDQAHYLITLPEETDFTGATVSVHLYVSGATGGRLFLYVQQATYEFWGQVPQDLSDFSGWTTIDWNVGAETTTGVDKTLIRRVGLEINGDGGAAWSNPTTVYIDSISVTSASLSFPFNAADSVSTTPATGHSTDTAMWLNSATADTTALTGSSIAWSASCP